MVTFSPAGTVTLPAMAVAVLPPGNPNVAPPLKVIAAEPRLLPEFKARVPPLTLTVPVKPLLVVPMVTVPEPLLLNEPDPLKAPTPESVKFWLLLK